MRKAKLWLYSMLASIIVMVLGALEITGIWAVTGDNLTFGLGIIITGAVMLITSVSGYLEAIYDEVAEILEDIDKEMTMYGGCRR